MLPTQLSNVMYTASSGGSLEKGSSEDPAQQVGVDQRAVVVRQLHKVHQWVALKDEGEFISRWAPVGHARGDSQIRLSMQPVLSDMTLLFMTKRRFTELVFGYICGITPRAGLRAAFIVCLRLSVFGGV
ncbi:hypothetical protein EYF80_001669 [Liparis tanakae]|uniref:Uncharacterized protein n=1 Tax=Liparis tanakae TaxID=230148 RepID=A0A4Z2JEN0_9TELE|nr:hypothetical protein EYF80_001669 [Liparis tanakae]